MALPISSDSSRFPTPPPQRVSCSCGCVRKPCRQATNVYAIIPSGDLVHTHLIGACDKRAAAKRSEDAAFFREIVETGAYRPVIDQRFVFDRTRDAHGVIRACHKRTLNQRVSGSSPEGGTFNAGPLKPEMPISAGPNPVSLRTRRPARLGNLQISKHRSGPAGCP